MQLLRKTEKVFPELENPESITELKIVHCKYKNIDNIKNLINLVNLDYTGFPNTDFDVFSSLLNLKDISICDMRYVNKIDGIKKLNNLEKISFRVLPNWHFQKKKTYVESFNDLSSLKNITFLRIYSIHPIDNDFTFIRSLTSLKELYVSPDLLKYGIKDIIKNRNNLKTNID